MKSSDSSNSTLKTALQTLEKKYGKGVVIQLKPKEIHNIPSTSTGSITLDKALGVGGIPHGRITEIYGPPSSGKTTLALHIIAEVQKKGDKALLIDSEHAFDPIYAQKIGVNVESLFVAQPEYGELALEVASQMIKTNEIKLIVVDSVAALIPKSELLGEIGTHQIGSQARLMSQALRKLASYTHQADAISIFINQIRNKINISFGNPETTSGGNALRFYSSVRLDIRRLGSIKIGEEEIIGNKTKVKVVKNKVAPPFKSAFFDIIYGRGISKSGELLDLALKYKIVNQAGSWFTYGGQKLGQGRQNACNNIDKEKDIFNELKAEIEKKK